MPLINDSADPHRRARELTKQRSNPIIANPQKSIMFPIANISTPTPIVPPEILKDRNLGRTNREARLKANMQRRNEWNDRFDIIVRPPIIPALPPPPTIPPVRPPPAPRPARQNRIISNRPGSRKFEITARANNNNKNPLVIPLIPPLADNKNDDFITPPDN